MITWSTGQGYIIQIIFTYFVIIIKDTNPAFSHTCSASPPQMAVFLHTDTLGSAEADMTGLTCLGFPMANERQLIDISLNMLLSKVINCQFHYSFSEFACHHPNTQFESFAVCTQ